MSQEWPPPAQPGQSAPTYDNTHESPENLLEETRGFLERFIAYPNPESAVAHSLWILHAHLVEAFDTTPRLAFLSPEPGSGKSRALELTEALVPRPELTVNNSVSFIFRSISAGDGLPTLLLDEADAVFSNKKADGNEDLRGLLNSGYRKGASVGRTSSKGRDFEVEKFPSFCAVAFAGLHRLPDTLMTRSVIVAMKKRRPDQKVESYRPRYERHRSEDLRERLAEYAETIREEVAEYFPELPETVVDRDADVWEPLIAIADKVGGKWPDLARQSATFLLAQGKNKPESFGVRLLRDIRQVFGDSDRLSTYELLDRLHSLEGSPWNDIKGKAIDARFLGRTLDEYEVESRTIRFGEKPLKGYLKADFVDTWLRYLPAETTLATSESNAVTLVTLFPDNEEVF